MINKHLGKRLFITGIPASGKSYLAQKLAKKFDGIIVSLDDIRLTLSKNKKYKKWTDFYLDKHELEYLTKTSPEKQWQDLVNQSEGLWPAILEEIVKYQNKEELVIFESVNILPYLAKKNLPFDGVVLLGENLPTIIERNTDSPRWGKTRELQKLEARSFYDIQRPKYREEAIKHNYQTYSSADTALSHITKLLK
ncbi:MAG: hypothetical protein WCJ59_01550 [bacterium]